MSEPVRWSDPRSKGPAAMRSLLRAARLEHPGADRLRKMSAGLGLTASAGAAEAATTSKVWAAALGLHGTKLAIVIASVAVVVAGGGLLRSQGSSRTARVETGAASASSPAGTPGPPFVPEPAVDRATTPVSGATTAAPAAPPRKAPPRSAYRAVPAGPTTPARPSPASPAPARAAPVAPATAAPSTEASLVQRARSALEADPAQALALADEADDRFPSGALVEERQVVAIEALVRLGRVDEARTRGSHFLRRFPASVHQRRVETLLGADPGTASP